MQLSRKNGKLLQQCFCFCFLAFRNISFGIQLKRGLYIIAKANLAAFLIFFLEGGYIKRIKPQGLAPAKKNYDPSTYNL